MSPDTIALERLRAKGYFTRADALKTLGEVFRWECSRSARMTRTTRWLDLQPRLGAVVVVGTVSSLKGGIPQFIYLALPESIKLAPHFRRLEPLPIDTPVNGDNERARIYREKHRDEINARRRAAAKKSVEPHEGTSAFSEWKAGRGEQPNAEST